ncbi:hypothetical protein Ahy_B01g056786 [Arachis hypogaea]|uniref:Uncharacterized protein n=1 Tax=Arachis hypogaea TaxID=3818 RepID=A0A445AZI3_ARAHY|nr:hypothetical protein Ahy_B01g056786 [Arachis hypogaea]
MATKNHADDPTDTEKAANGGDPPYERSPIEEVALVLPETDDPSLPATTFKAWTRPLTISAILMQILVLLIGRFMAATLPTDHYNFLD